MKRIGCPSPVRSNGSAALRVLGVFALAAWPAFSSTRPHPGGTLRVQITERLQSIDPRQTLADATLQEGLEQVDTLVFDRLVRLDEHGEIQPALALSWEHDAQSKQWKFRLREAVKCTDGTALTPAITAMALQQLLGLSFEVTATADSVLVQADHPSPKLAMELATGRYFIFRIAEDNSVIGTGPFRVAEWPANGAGSAVFLANETHWAGRPFVDRIELVLGANPEQESNAIAFGEADVVALPAAQAHAAAQRGIRVVSTEPVELMALALDTTRASIDDAQIRQAISLAINRTSIAGVILQKEGVETGALLPNWMTGYAHLFPPQFDLARAKELLASSADETHRSAPLVLAYDSSDAEAHAVADRVAVNLREAGITVRVSANSARGGAKEAESDLRLVRYRIVAPDTAVALSHLLAAQGDVVPEMLTAEQSYAAERTALDDFRVIPLVHISESFGLSAQVRDWMPPRWGGWRLDEVWLGPSAEAGGASH